MLNIKNIEGNYSKPSKSIIDKFLSHFFCDYRKGCLKQFALVSLLRNRNSDWIRNIFSRRTLVHNPKVFGTLRHELLMKY